MAELRPLPVAELATVQPPTSRPIFPTAAAGTCPTSTSKASSASCSSAYRSATSEHQPCAPCRQCVRQATSLCQATTRRHGFDHSSFTSSQATVHPSSTAQMPANIAPTASRDCAQIADQPRLWLGLSRAVVNPPYVPQVTGKWWSNASYASTSTRSHVGRIMETNLGEQLFGDKKCKRCHDLQEECWIYTTEGVSLVKKPGDRCARCRVQHVNCSNRGVRREFGRAHDTHPILPMHLPNGLPTQQPQAPSSSTFQSVTQPYPDTSANRTNVAAFLPANQQQLDFSTDPSSSLPFSPTLQQYHSPSTNPSAIPRPHSTAQQYPEPVAAPLSGPVSAPVSLPKKSMKRPRIWKPKDGNSDRMED
jgi:hypothetical protein